MKRLRYFAIILLLALLLTAGGYFLWGLFFNPITTIYNVSIDTEYIEFETVDKNNSKFILKNVQIGDMSGIIAENFNGSFELNSNVKVIIERVSFGSIIITVECMDCKSVGSIDDENDKLIEILGPYADFEILHTDKDSYEGTTRIFRMDGVINAGRTMGFEQADESTAVLKGGEIKLFGKSKFNNNYFEAASIDVNIGDKLVFENQKSKAHGFVIINESAGMKAAYRVEADEISIIRPGPRRSKEGQTYSATFIDSLYNDGFFKTLSVLFGALIFIISFFTFIMDVLLFFKSDKSESK